MFWIAWSFNRNLSTWDMSNVKNMSGMFHGADIFEGIELDQWNTSHVENVHGMFAATDLFNANLSSWDVRCVTDMSGVFTASKNMT
jgi:surface protein